MRIMNSALMGLLATTVLATPVYAQVETTAPPDRPEDAAPLGTSPAGEAGPAQAAPEQAPGASVEAEGGLADIVVTARRRVEPLQNTPLAISAVNQERLEEARVTTISDLSNLAPSLQLARNATNPTSLFPFLRGFGTKTSDPATEPPIAITYDGIYIGALIGAFINLFDVETVEVLRGPQGTLLGKNAPAGGVSIRTRRPGNDFGGMVQVDYGRFRNLQFRGYVDVPIVKDDLLATVSYFRQKSDGYFKNLTTGEDVGGIYTQTLRLGVLANLGDTAKWYISAQYDIDKGEDPSTRNVSTRDPLVIPTANYSAAPPPVSLTCTNAFSRHLCDTILPNRRRYTTYASDGPRRDSHGFSISSNLDVEAGPVTITSVTGFRKFREKVDKADIDGTPIAIIDSAYDGNYRQFSQELRLASSDGGGLDLGGRLNWLVGAYYYNFDYDRLNTSRVLGNLSPTFQDGTTNSYAVFAHAEYEFIDDLTLSGGIRQTWDRKTHSSCAARCFNNLDPTFHQRASWDNLSYDVTLSYNITPNNMIFVRRATGYRGGGFTGVPATAAAVAEFDSETVKAWEIGLKNDFFNHRLRVNIQGFFNKYDDLQRNITSPIPIPPFFLQIPRNIATAETKGIEVELLARPVRALTLRGSVGYLDAKYTDFVANLTPTGANGDTDNSALAFPYVSKWTVQVGATYEAELGSMGSITFAADYAYRSKYNTTEQNFAFAWQKGFGLLSASATWRDPSDRYSVSAYGRNLTDKFYIDGGDAIGGLSSFVSDGPPLEWGMSVGFRF